MFAKLMADFRLWLEPSLKTGEIVNNRYQISEMIGIGSYGISYLAMDLALNKQIVVKQSRKAKLKKSKGGTLYKKEYEMLAYLDHPNIPKPIDYFHENGSVFIVMEYIHGKTFEQLIFQDGIQFNEKSAFQILMQILAIVEFIHQKKIVHRDLRIPNIIAKDGDIFIIDFGLARYTDEIDLEKYKHFEKRLQREIHVRSDFYSLGHFLLFLLYSSYTPNSKVEKSWEEELEISVEAKKIIRRMLQLTKPYDDIYELKEDVYHLLEADSMIFV